MCGHDTSNRPRGGALAVLNPTMQDEPVFRGDLAFHTPGNPGSATATHARWTCEAGCTTTTLGDLFVVIHQSGDMTRRSTDCGLLHQFALAKASIVPTGDALELALDEPISLQVGDSGIIGRRVSIFSRRPSSMTSQAVAEGIVGFNFMQPATASL